MPRQSHCHDICLAWQNFCQGFTQPHHICRLTKVRFTNPWQSEKLLVPNSSVVFNFFVYETDQKLGIWELYFMKLCVIWKLLVRWNCAWFEKIRQNCAVFVKNVLATLVILFRLFPWNKLPKIFAVGIYQNNNKAFEMFVCRMMQLQLNLVQINMHVHIVPK